MANNFISYGKQWIDETDVQIVLKVLESDFLTQGPKVKEFEDAVASYVGAKYAVAVANGTAALHLAYLAAGIKNGDEVITTPITFLASSNAALYCDAEPIFSDIDSSTINISPEEVSKKVTKRTKLIVPVHFGGNPCDMVQLNKIGSKYNLAIIEDACHALGAKYKVGNKWIMIGSCAHSDMTVFSFHPVKHITTGEGGMITTNNKRYYEKLLTLRNHGMTRNPRMFKNKKMAFTKGKENLWYYEMQDLGFNYRITDLQCALGISQLKKINSFIKRRREVVSLYNSEFKNICDIRIPLEKKGFFSSYHLYVLRINFKRFGMARNDLMNKLKKMNIGTQVHYIPVYLQPYYKEKFNYKYGDYPIAEDYYSQTLSLPLYPKMTASDAGYVISAVKRCLGL